MSPEMEDVMIRKMHIVLLRLFSVKNFVRRFAVHDVAVERVYLVLGLWF